MAQWDMNFALGGCSINQQWIPFQPTISIEAIGGEFRLLFSHFDAPGKEETRGNDDQVISVVFGQNNNTKTTVGIGNPFREILSSTSNASALVSASNSPKSFWIGIDPLLGWLCIGAGNLPQLSSLFLQVKIPIQPYKWITTSNWDKPASVIIKYCLQTFPRSEKTRRLITNAFPTKFQDDATVAPSHGMTIVCPLPKTSLLYAVASSIQHELQNNSLLSQYLGVLDPKSLHMTVADLIFSDKIEKVQPHYQELNQRLEKIMESAPWTRFAMKIIPELHCGRTFRLNIQPYSLESGEGLQLWRNSVYKACGDICKPNPNYWFHITLAYVVYPMFNDLALSEVQRFCNTKQQLLNQLAPIILGPPVLSVFESMNNFPPYHPNK